MMKPRIARVAARAQVAIAAGTLPSSIIVGLISVPFGWETAAIAAISVVIIAGGTSSLLIPIGGMVTSWCWRD